MTQFISAASTTGWAARYMPLSARAIERAVDAGMLKDLAITLDMRLDSKSLSFAQMLSSAGCTVGFMRCDPAECAPIAVWETARGIVLSETKATFANEHSRLIDLSKSPLRSLLEDKIGIGQACVMALVDITNLQLAGRPIAVTGYTPEAKSIADYAMALGGRVSVFEADPITAAGALFDGHRVAAEENEIQQMDAIFVTSPPAAAMVSRHLQHLRSGALVCNTTSDVSRSDFIALTAGTRVREHVTAYQLEKGHRIKLIADGDPVHLSAAKGYPIEVTDAKFALFVGAIEQLQIGSAASERHELSHERETQVAKDILEQHQRKALDQ